MCSLFNVGELLISTLTFKSKKVESYTFYITHDRPSEGQLVTNHVILIGLLARRLKPSRFSAGKEPKPFKIFRGTNSRSVQRYNSASSQTQDVEVCFPANPD